MSIKEKVTIITSTHNRLEPLRAAVTSVLSQAYANWEYFVVSDGYDAKVRRLVKGLNDNRIKYFFTLETRYAGYLPRNIVLRRATGKYVFCIDDDNIIYPNYIEKMVNGFTSEEIGYVICQIKYDGYGIMAPRLPFVLGEVDMLNYMVRTRLARQVKGWLPYDYYSADFNFINRISQASKGNFLPEVLGWHRNLSNAGARLDHNKPLKIKINRLFYRVLSKIWLEW